MCGELPIFHGNQQFATHTFAALTGVGPQPMIAWSSPALGTPTRYKLNVSVATGVVQPGEVIAFGVNLYDATSFRLPAGILHSVRTYSGTISATVSPDSLTTPVLRSLLPSHTMSTDFGLFQP